MRLLLLGLLGIGCMTPQLPFSPAVMVDQLKSIHLEARDPITYHQIAITTIAGPRPAYQIKADFRTGERTCQLNSTIEKDRADEFQQLLFALRICEGNSTNPQQSRFLETVTFYEPGGKRFVYKNYNVQVKGEYQFLCKGMEDLYDFLQLQVKGSNCTEDIIGPFFETGRKRGRRRGAPEDGKTIKAAP